MVYMGWNQQEWAEAAAWFARVKGFSPLPDGEGAMLVRHAWLSSHSGSGPDGVHLLELAEWRWPSRTALERAVLLCDDLKECGRLREEFDRACRMPLGVEKNQTWAAMLFIAGLNAMFNVRGADEMVGRLNKLTGGDGGG